MIVRPVMAIGGIMLAYGLVVLMAWTVAISLAAGYIATWWRNPPRSRRHWNVLSASATAGLFALPALIIMAWYDALGVGRRLLADFQTLEIGKWMAMIVVVIVLGEVATRLRRAPPEPPPLPPRSTPMRPSARRGSRERPG